MKPFHLAGLAFTLALTALPSLAQAQPSQTPPDSKVAVKNFDVFVDPPTGFVFIKLPQGWKFVGKVEPSTLSSLPPTVLTSLLAEDAADNTVAKAGPEAN